MIFFYNLGNEKKSFLINICQFNFEACKLQYKISTTLLNWSLIWTNVLIYFFSNISPRLICKMYTCYVTYFELSSQIWNIKPTLFCIFRFMFYLIFLIAIDYEMIFEKQ